MAILQVNITSSKKPSEFMARWIVAGKGLGNGVNHNGRPLLASEYLPAGYF